MLHGSPSSSSSMDRRAFLRLSGRTAAGVAASLLAACTGDATQTNGRRPIGVDAPITLPYSDGNPPVESGLRPERRATLRILEWREYLSHAVVADFAKVYDVDFEISSFENRDKGAGIIQNGGAFDVFFPTIDQLGHLAANGLLQPLNHDYVPNVRSLWPQFAPPDGAFYDRGLRYSVPYTVFSTGIGWRSDLVAPRDAPPELDDPYAAYWNPSYRSKVGLYDDYREAIATAILRNGSTEVDTTDPSILRAAREALMLLVDRVGAVFDTEGAYEGLPEGEFAIHQAWSGDILSAGRFGSAYTLGTANDLRYFWPDDGRGIVGADLMAIPAKAPNPVLAHRFLNHMLDPANALGNFAWNGYQPPVDGVTREALTSRSSFGHRIVPPNLANALLTPGDVDRALTLRPLSPSAQSRWLRVWTSVPDPAASS